MRTLPDDILAIANRHLTPKQLEVWLLEARGLAQRGIAWHLDISRSSVLDRLDGAHRTLRKHGVRQDLGTGNYYLEETTNGEPIPELPTPPTSTNGRSEHPQSSPS